MSTLISSLIHETSTTTGTGNFTISAVTARRRFSDGWSTGGTTNVFYYAILHRTVNEYEYGTGHISATSTLVRDTVIKSSNANALVSFSAGDKDVINDLPAENMVSVADAAATYQPLDTDLTSWAGVTRASGFDTFAATPSSANLSALLTDEQFSMSDVELGALAGLTSAANKLPYFSGSGTAALADLSAAMRTFMTTPSSANLAALVSDDAFQLDDVELSSIAGLTSAANKFPYYTGSGTAALADLSSAMRTFLTTSSSANLAAVLTDDTFSMSDAELGAIAGLTSAADKFPYFSGSGTAALADLSSAMRTFLTTPTSANFAAVVSNETGSGLLVFATSPALTTPDIGTPSAGTLTNCTSLPAAGVTGTAVVQARNLGVSGLVTGGGTLAADRTFTVTAATSTDQETGTSTTVAVVPNVQQRHPGHGKFFVNANQAGGMNGNYNMTSVSDGGTGNVAGTIATDFSSSSWGGGGFPLNAAAATIQLTAMAAGTFTSVSVTTNAPVAVADVSAHLLGGWGDQ